MLESYLQGRETMSSQPMPSAHHHCIHATGRYTVCTYRCQISASHSDCAAEHVTCAGAVTNTWSCVTSIVTTVAVSWALPVTRAGNDLLGLCVSLISSRLTTTAVSPPIPGTRAVDDLQDFWDLGLQDDGLGIGSGVRGTQMDLVGVQINHGCCQ